MGSGTISTLIGGSDPISSIS